MFKCFFYFFIYGNEAVALVNELKPLVGNEDVDVVFCVPAISIIPAMEAAPFHTTVFAPFNASLYNAIVLGPISNPDQPASIESTTAFSVSLENSFPTT